MAHPISGPVSPETLKALADAPYGKAAEVLRQHDPLWGSPPVEPGTARQWKVFVTQEVTMQAYVTIEAATEEEACTIAETMSDQSFAWDFNSADSVVAQYAEPK